MTLGTVDFIRGELIHAERMLAVMVTHGFGSDVIIDWEYRRKECLRELIDIQVALFDNGGGDDHQVA